MATNEKPILFSGRLVRAILAGKKTQTRRIMKPQPSAIDERMGWVHAKAKSWVELSDVRHLGPYGKPGDQLWVKETHFALELQGEGIGNAFLVYTDEYNDGDPMPSAVRPWRHDLTPKVKFGKRPSIFMPRWASRIQLAVTDIRIELLQDMPWQDAIAEGIEPVPCEPCHDGAGCTDCMGTGIGENPVHQFAELWDSINAKRGYGWDSNPWVWVVEFKRVQIVRDSSGVPQR